MTYSFLAFNYNILYAFSAYLCCSCFLCLYYGMINLKLRHRLNSPPPPISIHPMICIQGAYESP